MMIFQRVSSVRKRRKKVKSMKAPIMRVCKTVKNIRYCKPTKRRTECIEVILTQKRYIIIPIQCTPTSSIYQNVISMIAALGVE